MKSSNALAYGFLTFKLANTYLNYNYKTQLSCACDSSFLSEMESDIVCYTQKELWFSVFSSSDEPFRFLLSRMAPPPCASLDLPKMAEDEGAWKVLAPGLEEVNTTFCPISLTKN